MERMNQSIREAEWALLHKPMFATSVERVTVMREWIDRGRELPQPLRFARYLADLLARVSVPLAPYDRIAGRCLDRELSNEEEQTFQELLKHPETPRKTFLFGTGHCTFSWQMIVEEGLPGMRERAKRSLARQNEEEHRIFLSAIIEMYDAIEAYLLRYADAAEAQGMTALAESLRRSATERPSRFRDALQLLWIVTMIDCAYMTPNPTLTVGRLDQILLPLYRADLAAGRMTREEAAELITDYYCKHNLIMGRGEHQVGDAENSTTFDRIFCFDAPQYLLLAGTDERGNSAVNELTQLFAEQIRPAFKNPVIVVRYTPGLNEQYPALWQTLVEKAIASSSMMFYNDDNVIRAFLKMGVPEEYARSYAHFGCNWVSLGDRSAWMNGGPSSSKFGTFESEEEKRALQIPFMRTNSPHSWPEDFVMILRELAACGHEVTIEDFYTRFFERMGAFMDRKLAHLSRELSVRRRRPAKVLAFGDCFFEESLESGECHAASATYHFGLMAFQMFGTVADCFIVTDKLVFLDKRLTLSELYEAVAHNFEGYEDVLALCRGVEKYGSDSEHANAHVRRLSQTASDMLKEKNRPYLERDRLLLTPNMQSDTWHLKYGEQYGATPDGRLAYTPYSQNMRPSNGACVNGVTAMLHSMLSIPADGFASGSLNLDIDPNQFRGETGKRLFGDMLAAYFNGGGLHAQVSSGNREQMLDAQAHPENHGDLRVRVTGYSGIFVDIPKKLQDDIIERFQ